MRLRQRYDFQTGRWGLLLVSPSDATPNAIGGLPPALHLRVCVLLARRGRQGKPHGSLQGCFGRDDTIRRAAFRQEGSVTVVEWVLKDGATLHLVANLSDEPARLPTSPSAERLFSLGSSTDETLSPWAVISSTQSTQG
ncbi:DUF3459 domain-containing protein [Neorhizobium sp. LjRoot104]|uniref:DUF3459 domain-containing protein n=1 Tax=Neorhizobium sp. LjRoot104 TaxID=3342254 RepID=UPI003F4FA081